MYTKCMGPPGAAKAKRTWRKKRNRSKIIRHALDTTHLSRQTEHPHITLGSRTVTQAHLPWQHFLGYRVGTWAVKRGENKEICWRTYCVRLGPPNWVPPSTHMPHKCDLWTLAGAQHAGPWHRLKLKLPCCCSVKTQKTTGQGVHPRKDTCKRFSIKFHFTRVSFYY